MNQLRQNDRLGYEDLMRELERFEHDLLKENGDMAMSLMVLEAKIRERFQLMESRLWDKYYNFNIEDGLGSPDDLSNEELQAMIPKDLTVLSSLGKNLKIGNHKRTLETICMAAALAVVTAVGVFGLASILQLTLNWFS